MAEAPRMQAIRKLKVQRRVAASLLAMGTALMAMMIVTEGEPGLIPLALVVLGGGGWFVVHRRLRARGR